MKICRDLSPYPILFTSSRSGLFGRSHESALSDCRPFAPRIMLTSERTEETPNQNCLGIIHFDELSEPSEERAHFGALKYRPLKNTVFVTNQRRSVCKTVFRDGNDKFPNPPVACCTKDNTYLVADDSSTVTHKISKLSSNDNSL